jgi:hypothetical protein
MAVASVIGAKENGVGMVGILPSEHLELVFAKNCGPSSCDPTNGATAIVWMSGGSVDGIPDISHPVDAINISQSGLNIAGCSSYTQEAINFAIENGVTIVVGAGNSTRNAKNHGPANCKGVITVAATDNYDEDLAGFSNYFDTLNGVAAPGENIIAIGKSDDTSVESSNYTVTGGTSLAAPLVTGTVAGLKLTYPDLTPYQMLQILQSNASIPDLSAKGLAHKCVTLGCGGGIMDASKALSAIEDFMTTGSYRIKHAYKNISDTTYLKVMDSLIPICNLYELKIGALGYPKTDVEYRIYSSSEETMTIENSILVKTVTDPIFRIEATDKLGYQVCRNNECSSLFEIDYGNSEKPEFCEM